MAGLYNAAGQVLRGGINATNEVTPYEQALREVVRLKNIDGASVRNLVDSIAYHETGGDIDNQALAQMGGGPARGVMQFEPARFQDSVKRARRHYAPSTPEDSNITPEWIRNIPTRNLKYKNNKVIRDKQFQLAQQDITNLTVDQQKALATYDLLNGPSNLADVTKGKTSVADFWADKWWRGSASKRTEQIEHFNRSMQNRDQRAAANKAAEKAALEAALEAARGDPITNAINRVNGIAEQDMFPLYV